MNAKQQDRSGRDRPGDKGRPQSLSAHPAFAPILGVWGVLLGGLVVLVLPLAMVDQAVAGTGLAGRGAEAQWLLAVVAALVIGGGLYLVASQLSAKARACSDAGQLIRGVSSILRPIDPVTDLGCPSFDAPLSDMPFPVAAAEPAREMRRSAQPVAPAPAAAPRELDLAQFAQLPGRNAVWVEEPVAPPHHEARVAPVAVPPAPTPAPAPAPPSATALDRLRAVPPEELSTVQMVERFAAALHEHRDPVSGSASHHRAAASREAALAEALKALAALSKQDGSPAASEPLREAIAQLQPRRGAA